MYSLVILFQRRRKYLKTNVMWQKNIAFKRAYWPRLLRFNFKKHIAQFNNNNNTSIKNKQRILTDFSIRIMYNGQLLSGICKLKPQ